MEGWPPAEALDQLLRALDPRTSARRPVALSSRSLDGKTAAGARPGSPVEAVVAPPDCEVAFVLPERSVGEARSLSPMSLGRKKTRASVVRRA